MRNKKERRKEKGRSVTAAQFHPVCLTPASEGTLVPDQSILLFPSDQEEWIINNHDGDVNAG